MLYYTRIQDTPIKAEMQAHERRAYVLGISSIFSHSSWKKMMHMGNMARPCSRVPSPLGSHETDQAHKTPAVSPLSPKARLGSMVLSLVIPQRFLW